MDYITQDNILVMIEDFNERTETNSFDLIGLLIVLRIFIEKNKIELDDAVPYDAAHKSLHYVNDLNYSKPILVKKIHELLKSIMESDVVNYNQCEVLERCFNKIRLESELIVENYLKECTLVKEDAQFVGWIQSCSTSHDINFQYEILAVRGEKIKFDKYDNLKKFRFFSNTPFKKNTFTEIKYSKYKSGDFEFWMVKEKKNSFDRISHYYSNLIIKDIAREFHINENTMYKTLKLNMDKIIKLHPKIIGDRGILNITNLIYFGDKHNFYEFGIENNSKWFKKNFPIHKSFFGRNSYGPFSPSIREKDVISMYFPNHSINVNQKVQTLLRRGKLYFKTDEENYLNELSYNDSLSSGVKSEFDIFTKINNYWYSYNLASAISSIVKMIRDASSPIKFNYKYINEKRKHNFIFGVAGSGKSYNAKQTVSQLLNNKIFEKAIILTPTHKAKWVYRDFVNQNTIVSSTIEKFISDYSESNYSNNVFFVIDEISMLSYENWIWIEKNLSKWNIFFLGDYRQLQPIGQQSIIPEIFKYFKETEKNIFELRLSDVPRESSRFTNERILDLNNTMNSHTATKNKTESLKKKISSFMDNWYSVEELYRKIKEKDDDDTFILMKNNTGFVGTKAIAEFLKKQGGKPNYEIGDQIIFTREYGNFKNNHVTTISNIKISSDKTTYIVDNHTFEVNLLNDEDEELPFDIYKVTTVHRSQGSSFKKVIVIIDSQVEPSWFYTAASRARESIVFLVKGDLQIDEMINFGELDNKILDLIKNHNS